MSSNVASSSPSALPELAVMLPRDLPHEHLIPFARRVEELGFGAIWVVEDLGFHGGIAQAGMVLATTERLRVGIGILPAAARNVAFTAMDLATLAGSFPGRLDIGLGHGIPGWIKQAGAWPASPLTLLREQTLALRGLLSGSCVSVEGRYVRLDAVRLANPPAVAPPIFAGVRGPRSLALAGEVADGVVLAEPITPGYVELSLERAGRRDLQVVTYNVAAVDDDAEAAREAVRPGLEWVGEPDWDAHVAHLPYAEDFRELRASSSDRAEFTRGLPAAWVEDLAVAGTPEQVRARLEAQRAAGVTTAVLTPTGGDPWAAIESLARVV